MNCLQKSSYHREAPTTSALSVPQHHRLHKAFDRVWHAGLCHILRSFLTEEGLVQAIQVLALHENSSSAALLNSQLGEFFETAVSIHQGYVLSPILFKLILEKIMQEILHDHPTSTPIGGRPIRNLQYASKISLMGDSNGELLRPHHQTRTESKSIWNGSQHRKSKIMTIRKSNISADICRNGQKLEEVTVLST